MGFDASVRLADNERKGPVWAPVPQPRLRRLAMVGDYPPRQCGIATFTRDAYASLRARLPEAHWDIIVINDPGSEYDYPADVTHVIPQNDTDAYVSAADALNEAGVEVVLSNTNLAFTAARLENTSSSSFAACVLPQWLRSTPSLNAPTLRKSV